MSGRVQRVVVVGRDAAAWIAALGLQRAVGRSGVSVTALELPSLIEPSDVYAAVPSLAALHELLGVEESLFVGKAGAVPMVAQRFSNWSRSRPPFFLGYDSDPPQQNDLDFLQYWLKARGQGLKVGHDDFSLAAAAAKQGRVPSPEAQGELGAAHGYQVDAGRYAGLLKHLALKAGVAHRTGRIQGIERDGERIVAIAFEGGERFEADLFVDASGPEGLLIRTAPGARTESWADLLPCDRIFSGSAPALAPLPAFSQVSAFRAGWVALHPLKERTAVVAAYSTRFATDEMLENLSAIAGVAVSGDAVVSPFQAGMRAEPWAGNVVAIGEAAVSLEPLDAVQLHIAHVGLSHLVSLFPATAGAMPEASGYNEAMATHARNIRDFQIAHYRLNQRFDEPFWDSARDAPVPDALRAKLDLFASRGLVALGDGESFQEPSWAALFIGHGLVPDSYDPRIDLVPREEHMMKVQQRLRTIASEVNAMPRLEDVVNRYARPQAAAPWA